MRIFSLLLLCIALQAQVTTRYNPWTGKPDYLSSAGEPDTAVYQTRANAQSGQDLYLKVTSNATDAFVATGFSGGSGRVFSAYTDGMVVLFPPNHACGAAPTINIDGRGLKNLYDTASTRLTCASGDRIQLTYDAALNANAGGFRRLGGGSVALAVTSVGDTTIGGQTPFGTVHDDSLWQEWDEFTGTTSNWYLSWTPVTGTGGSATAIAGDANHPGAARANNGTDATNGFTGSGRSGAGGGGYWVGLTTTPGWELRFIFRYTTALTNGSYRVGFADTNAHPTAAGFDGFNALFRSGTDTNIMFEVCNNGACTTTADSGVAGAADTWYRMRMWSTVAGTLNMQINNGSTVCYNAGGTSGCQAAALSSANMFPMFMVWWNTVGTSRVLDVDRYSFSRVIAARF